MVTNRTDCLRVVLAGNQTQIMPAISLVVCLYKERDLLERLLQNAGACYDDLVVIHDGAENDSTPIQFARKPLMIDYSKLEVLAPLPAGYQEPVSPAKAGGVHELVSRHVGRYFEGPRAFQQEPHWPFAWSRARHDWILRFDVDEYPSKAMEVWLRDFRQRPEPNSGISGFTCIWPLWNGRKAVTKNWPGGRIFLFNKQRVRFFGMAEASPIPETGYAALNLILHHEPSRKSYGIRNILCRRQAYHWRRVIV